MSRALASLVVVTFALAACSSSSGGTGGATPGPTGGSVGAGGTLGSVGGAAGAGPMGLGGAGQSVGGAGSGGKATAGSSGAGKGGAGAGGATGGQSGAAPYPRTISQRPLYATKSGNLILDAFTTPDLSTGHVVAYSPTTNAGLPFKRRITSSSPAGVSAPIAIFDATTAPAPTGGLAALDAWVGVPGSAQPLVASVWVSASDATGAAVPFASAQASFFARVTATDGSTVAKLDSAAPPVTIDGRQWVKLSTSGSVSLATGGFFMMLAKDTSWVFYVQAPELVVAPPGMALSPVLPVGEMATLPPETQASEAPRTPRHPGARATPGG